jgi:hypothetical protein
MELISNYLSRGSAWIDDENCFKSSFGTRSCRFNLTAAIFMFCHVTSRETNLAVGMGIDW